MTPPRTLAAAVVTLALGLPGAALALGTPSYAATSAAPTTVRRAAAPAVPVLAGRVLSLPSGAHVTLPFPASHAKALYLLGQTGRGTVVLDHSTKQARVYLAVGTSKRLIHRVADPRHRATYRLAPSGKRILQAVVATSGATTMTVLGIGGRTIAHHTWGKPARILDFTGGEAVIETRHPYVWQIGSAPHPISTRGAAVASIAHDLIWLLMPGDDANGPTSLTMPTTPSYYRLFDPEVVSPDGTSILGEGADGMSVEVHEVDNGDLLAQNILGHSSDHALTWESNADYLIVTRSGGQEFVQRCDVVSGTCVHTGAGTPKTQPVTVGFQDQG